MRQQLDIETPDEFWADYTKNYTESNGDITQKLYNSLVNKLNIKYFVPYIHDETSLPQDLRELFDHPCRVLTADNRYYTIVQPYNYVKIKQIVNKYYLKNYVAWTTGFRYHDVYAIIFTDEIIEFLSKSALLLNGEYKNNEERMKCQIEYLNKLYRYAGYVLPDELRTMTVE